MTSSAARRVQPEMASPSTASSQTNRRSPHAGFIYVGLLLLVALFGLGLTGAMRMVAATERAGREAELLFVGAQFRDAIASYYTSSPGMPRYPESLEQLLQDPRFPSLKRHLRRIYVDPVSGSDQWGLVQAPGGGIMGIHSLSTLEPLKRSGFTPPNQAFDAIGTGQAGTAPTYRDWKFVFLPAANRN